MASASTFVLLLLGTPASADTTVIASGLDNPRGVAVSPSGAILVAEAGVGGDEVCFDGAEGDVVCYGYSGAITSISRFGQHRIIDGLPSYATDGFAAIGPAAVGTRGAGQTFLAIGLGGSPDLRTDIGAGSEPMGTLQRVQSRIGRTWALADIAAFEASDNPDGGAVDSNPNGIAVLPTGIAVADAGGNSLVWVDRHGDIETLAVFEDRLVDAPEELGLPDGTQLPMQSVPTSVAQGCDGDFYVGELTGYPFEVGSARVLRVPADGGDAEVYAEGFTNVIGVASDGGCGFYVLELATYSLLSDDMSGALWHIDDDGAITEVAADGLVYPGGVAVTRDGRVVVSNYSIFPSIGELLLIDP